MTDEILHLSNGADGTSSLAYNVLTRLKLHDIRWISENRDWAEATRYELKDEVDSNLIESPIVSTRRKEIERIFQQETSPESPYLELLLKDWSTLHTCVKSILERELANEWSASSVVGLWLDFAPVADADNAHAMYLSSGNWDFSVFNRLTTWIYSLPVPDQLRSALLTGGVQDIRTVIYQADFLKELRDCPGRENFAERVAKLGYAVTRCVLSGFNENPQIDDGNEIKISEMVKQIAA